jgi:hypothetical protein
MVVRISAVDMFVKFYVALRIEIERLKRQVARLD